MLLGALPLLGSSLSRPTHLANQTCARLASPHHPQVLAPLVRRFQALRARLIHNDLASKHRLDTAAGQLK